jgi:predicted RNA-binding Zn-ribbon protein involved in translation (DUF1610 family)
MGTLSSWIWLISILGKGGGGGRGKSRRKVRRCENCGRMKVRTSGSSFRCQNCGTDPGGQIAKSVENRASSGGGDLAD